VGERRTWRIWRRENEEKRYCMTPTKEWEKENLVLHWEILFISITYEAGFYD
jgi:hypothetical protein